MLGFRKYPSYPPHGGFLEIPRGKGVSQAQIVKGSESMSQRKKGISTGIAGRGGGEEGELKLPLSRTMHSG